MTRHFLLMLTWQHTNQIEHVIGWQQLRFVVQEDTAFPSPSVEKTSYQCFPVIRPLSDIACMRLAPYFLRPAAAATAAGLRAPDVSASASTAANRPPCPSGAFAFGLAIRFRHPFLEWAGTRLTSNAVRDGDSLFLRFAVRHFRFDVLGHRFATATFD